MLEGTADAFGLSIVHRRQATLTGASDFSSTEQRSLVATNVMLPRGAPSTSLVHDALSRYVQVGDTCSSFGPGGGPANAYAVGMMLPQIMWQLINNARCDSFNNCANPQTISSSTRFPFLARKAFSTAIINNGWDHPKHVAFAWRAVLRRLLAQEGLLTTQTATNLNLVFGDHGI